MKKIVDLSEADSDFGGKAYGLACLSKLNIPIPKGFVISDKFIEEIEEGNQKSIDELNTFVNTLNRDNKLAIRSSAKAEDGVENSFAGMFETKLNVKNDTNSIVQAIKEVNQSKNSTRVKSYSNDKSQEMNIVIQEMVQPIIAGVGFTKAIDIDGTNVVQIECVEGLAEKLVSGAASPSTIKIKLDKNNKMQVKDFNFSGKIVDIKGIKNLLPIIQKVIDSFEKPMDIEWCIDEENKPYLVQARPITKIPFINNKNNSKGIIASPGFATNQTYVIDEDLEDSDILKAIENFPDKSILVAATTDTQYVPAMKRASGIITEEGSSLSHAAIISRELGIPCIAGYKNARKLFPTGTKITLDASNGRIISDKIEDEISDNKSFEFGELYYFDNIIPVKIEDDIILFEPTIEGLFSHMPEDIDNSKIDKIEEYARKTFKQSPTQCQTSKYLWYFELERFKKLPYFNELLEYARFLSKEKDPKKTDALYNLTVSRLDNLVKYKDNVNDMEKVFIEEICVAYNFILNSALPDGYAVVDSYNETLTPLFEKGYKFNDILNNNITDWDKEGVLKKNSNFLNCISKNRNEICGKMVDIGAMSYDYFDKREEKMKEALNLDNCDGDIVDVFYSYMPIKNLEINNILINKQFVKKNQIDEEIKNNESR